MRKTLALVVVLCAVMLAVTGTAGAATYAWDFANAADYYVDGDWWTNGGAYAPVITEGTGAYVPARPWINSYDDLPYGSDWAAVFARVNTQASHLNVSNITGGGFTVSGMNNPNAVYGSLYLSPTGGSGSTVLINISPMTRTGADGDYTYTFGLDSRADVLANAPNWSYAQPQGSLTFGQVIDWVNSSSYSGSYAAYFGPQIGMSGTSGTTFTVSEISLTATPEPATMMLMATGVLGLAGAMRRRLIS